jgi:transposase
MEACLSAHFVTALRQLGHQPRIIPAIYVKPFVKGQKNDYIGAEAIAEAALRPNLRVVREKTRDQLDLQALHRVRSGLVSRRTATINQIRAFLIEQGIAVRTGAPGSAQLAHGDPGEPSGRDIGTDAHPDRGPP